MKFRNNADVSTFVAGEQAARKLMLPHYPALGLTVINTNGNRERDIVCQDADTGKPVKVEEKYRDTDYGDFAIEILHDMETGELGWYYKTRGDLLAYIVCDKSWTPQKVYLVNWTAFKEWWLQYLADLKRATGPISPRGIGLTLNLTIDWPRIPPHLYKFYSLVPTTERARMSPADLLKQAQQAKAERAERIEREKMRAWNNQEPKELT